jgi:hypothetical protein
MMTALMVLDHEDEVDGHRVSNRRDLQPLQVIDHGRKRMMGVSFMLHGRSVFYPFSLYAPHRHGSQQDSTRSRTPR